MPRAVLSLKKLVKKDPTTKLKALAELSAYFEDPDRSDEDIVAALPMWQQSFVVAAEDLDRRVRENTFITMRKLLSRSDAVKKQLSKYLKDLLFPWLCGRFDPDAQVLSSLCVRVCVCVYVYVLMRSIHVHA